MRIPWGGAPSSSRKRHPSGEKGHSLKKGSIGEQKKFPNMEKGCLPKRKFSLRKDMSLGRGEATARDALHS